MTYLPRFHPMIWTFGDRNGWWIMDCCARSDPHKPQVPYSDEPCDTYDEAKEICDMLNETEPDPRVERDRRESEKKDK